MRIAMRALLGLDPDDAGHGAAAAEHFESALSFYGTEFHMRLLRGPGSPWRRLTRSRDVLDEIVLLGDPPAPGATRPGARSTSSACCSRPATRTAAGSPTKRCATR